MSIDRMGPGDIDAVLEIERQSFRPVWSRQAISEELARAWARLDVVRDGPLGQVVAFANYWLVADELQILNIATDPHQRRLGHGTSLLAHMIEVARAHPCRVISLEVRRSNETAQRLYQRFSFRSVGVRPNYYSEDQEDAILMLLDLP
jgi:ribosomal-protein-alanine N-acetyltransferase